MSSSVDREPASGSNGPWFKSQNSHKVKLQITGTNLFILVQSIGAKKPVDRSLCDKSTTIGTNAR